MFHARITDCEPKFITFMIKNGTLARELMNGLTFDVSKNIEIKALYIDANAKPYYPPKGDDTIVRLRPQPEVEPIRSGWDVSGVPCFMGTAEYHIRTDRRWPGFKRVWLGEDKQWWGELCSS